MTTSLTHISPKPSEAPHQFSNTKNTPNKTTKPYHKTTPRTGRAITTVPKQFNNSCKFYIAYFSPFAGLNTAQVNCYCIIKSVSEDFYKSFFYDMRLHNFVL